MKICSKCLRDKLVKDFNKDISKKDGLRGICRECDHKTWALNKEHNNLNQRINYSKNKTQINSNRNQKRRDNPQKYLWQLCKTRANKKNLNFDLDINDIIIPNNCPVLGIPLKHNFGGKNNSLNSPSIDRIDNTKGYTKDNIIIISWKANRLKNDGTIEDLEKIVIFYKELNKNVKI